MDSMIYLTGSRMNGLVDELQIIAANLANANTAGFKRTVGKFKAVLQLAAPAPAGAQRPAAVSPHWPELTGARIDFSQGPTRWTGRPLDLAVRGGAFFVVETEAGQRYTRKGRLYVSAQGELTDGTGNPFASDSGTLRIPDGSVQVSIDQQGQVTADGAAIGRLMLVDIPQPEALAAEGAARFRNDGPRAVPAVGSQIVQGAIEQSNVNPVRAMVALVGVMRAYEAAARIVRRLDSLNGELIKTAA